LAGRIAERLGWAPDLRDELKAFPKYQKRSLEKESVQLTVDHFNVISDWYHFAILSLAETQDFNDEPAAIARRLNITKTQASAALERLTRLGMLERGPSGKLFATGASYSSSDDLVSSALRKSHAQNLELARRSLEEDAMEERDFISATMAIDPALLPEAKRRLREFRADLCAFLESGAKKEVYKVSMQLFPLSKNEDEK
jgi:uncharacterized protein (TIGR02147 family)